MSTRLIKTIFMKMITRFLSIAIILVIIHGSTTAQQGKLTYPIVDTDQETFYDTIIEIPEPMPGMPFYGQDAHYTGFAPDYQDNGDGTVTDLITGLMWSKSPDMEGDGDIDYDDKMSFDEAMAGADTFSLAGYDDWRLPSIKELYSLIIFSGKDPSGYNGTSTEDLVPFIDTNYFDFAYGDVNSGERLIDAQMVSSTLYVATTMGGAETMFGVNFADGRIKGYPTGPNPGQSEDKRFYVYYVRGNTDYGINDFHDNGDGTATDNATGLMWMKNDNGAGVVWQEALTYAENSEFAGYTDWRLPNAKELQSILDYTRAPTITNSPAIDPLFNCTVIEDEGGKDNYPFYWSGTTHASWQENTPGGYGAYICFGEALGWMEEPPMSGNYTLMDVHGAGAQRSDPKTGDPANWPYGHGPQGDVIRIFNFVRLVRNVDSTMGFNKLDNDLGKFSVYPNPCSGVARLRFLISDSGYLISELYMISGRKVRELINEMAYPGEYEIEVDVSDLPAGIYVVSLQSGNSITTGRLIVRH
jgi:hypothetical protein